MYLVKHKGVRMIGLAAAVAGLSACGLPRSGPTMNEILSGSVQRQGDAFVVPVDDRVARASSAIPVLGFDREFLTAGLVGSDTIRPGDTLGLTVYENVQDGLLAPQGTGSATLEEVQVDGEGFIFVPYAGRIRASGNTPDQIRELITERLEVQTPDPQILVRRVAGDGSTVSLIGGVSAQGVYPIERPTRRLSAMLARAGGVSIPPEIAEITVTRGGRTGQVWLQDLYSNPELDIALRGGDRVLVEQDQRTYTALGATGAQTRVQFETQTISAIEAIAQVGGLNPSLADPTGVFIFRNERPEIVNAVLGRSDLATPQRVIYILNLTDPNGLFVARDFAIKDGDTVFVTEAPFAQFTKVLTSVAAPLTTAGSISQLAQQ